MKINIEGNELNDFQKQHAAKILREMINAVDSIEHDFIMFCTDEDNKIAAKKIIDTFIEEEGHDDLSEPAAFLSIFKAKLLSEYKNLNISINKYN